MYYAVPCIIFSLSCQTHLTAIFYQPKQEPGFLKTLHSDFDFTSWTLIALPQTYMKEYIMHGVCDWSAKQQWHGNEEEAFPTCPDRGHHFFLMDPCYDNRMRQKLGTAVRKNKGHKMLRRAAPLISSPHRNKSAERGNVWGYQAETLERPSLGQLMAWRRRRNSLWKTSWPMKIC